MVKLSEEAKIAVNRIRPSVVATASKSGKPNVSAKSSLRVLDDEHILFAHISSPRTVANISENPQVAILCLDAATRKGVRIWGTGEILESGDIFNSVAAELAGKYMKVQSVVRITVEEVEIF